MTAPDATRPAWAALLDAHRPGGTTRWRVNEMGEDETWAVLARCIACEQPWGTDGCDVVLAARGWRDAEARAERHGDELTAAIATQDRYWRREYGLLADRCARAEAERDALAARVAALEAASERVVAGEFVQCRACGGTLRHIDLPGQPRVSLPLVTGHFRCWFEAALRDGPPPTGGE